MKGTNKLVLNEATMIEALQEYLDKRMPEHAPRVTGVESTANDDTFDVTTADKSGGMP